MQNILNYCGEIRRVATTALSYTLHGTGIVLIGTGTVVVVTGELLQCCARRLRNTRTTRIVKQPAH